jgi:hypothetical protein
MILLQLVKPELNLNSLVSTLLNLSTAGAMDSLPCTRSGSSPSGLRGDTDAGCICEEPGGRSNDIRAADGVGKRGLTDRVIKRKETIGRNERVDGTMGIQCWNRRDHILYMSTSMADEYFEHNMRI